MKSLRRTNKTGITNKEAYEKKKFGLLTVVEYVNARTVICKCRCGNEIVTRKYKLDNGSINSCGCNSEHSINKTKYEQITNEEFTVKEYINAHNILCVCSCGNEFITTKQHIDNNEVHSCGCRHHIINYDKKYALERKGYLKILRHIGYGYYECECDCGNICYKSKASLDAIAKPSCGCKAHEKTGQSDSNKLIQNRIAEYLDKYPKSTIQSIASDLDLSYSTVLKNVNKMDTRELVNYHSNISALEKELGDYIASITDIKIEYNTRDIIKPNEIDIYLPEKKIAIEFNGNYWHSELYNDKNYHIDKTIACMQKGLRLIHIFEYEWTKPDSKKSIKKYLYNILSDNKTVVYARNTIVKEISTDEYREFTAINHLQGNVNASIKLGLINTSDGELLGTMSFDTPRFNANYQYELLRLCWKSNVKVIGGAEKLFKYFTTKYKPESIITYCDISKFTGDVYKRLGFNELSITEPNYVWLSHDNKTVISRYKTQKNKLIRSGLGTSDQTENEIMHKLGYYKMYDCGNLKFEWKAN